MPTTGNIPKTIPILIKTSHEIRAVIPNAMIVPNKSLACKAIFIPQKIIAINMMIKIRPPTKPHSSAKTEKTKSVCCSGKNFNWVWEPLKKPLPKISPEPTAIMDWMI